MEMLKERLEDAIHTRDRKRQEYEAAEEDVAMKKHDLDFAQENRMRETRDRLKHFSDDNNDNNNNNSTDGNA